MAASYMQHHMKIAHGRVLPQVRGVYFGGGGLEVYKVSFTLILTSVDFPVEGCPAKEKKTESLREHFMFCHWISKVDILKEGPELLPRCDQFGMHMQAVRIFKHRHSNKCLNLTERRLGWRDVEMAARCGEMDFSTDGEEGDERVNNVPTFWYLGQPIDQTGDDFPALRQNIMHTRSVWGRLGKQN